MPLMQLDLLHGLNETFLIKEMISIFSLWISHLYVVPFKQHLQMDYTSLSWNDVRLHGDLLHEFSYPLSSLCHKWTLICSVCTDYRSFLSSWLMWHITGCWCDQHDKCHLWNRTLFTILIFCVQLLVTQMLSSDFPYAYWVSNWHCI